ncbi:MAG: hypothetical protein E6Q25_07500 [Acinetobacter sp.]|nr:MAG: hypothetical protein E6Q25_07500 [Acinetobacter sp.]
MKTLTKLALVSAMAISANAMAAQLQSLTEDEMSAQTGQDGISIVIAGDIEADVVVHDKLGYNSTAATGGPTPARTALGFTGAAGTTADSGAIVLDGFSIKDTGATKKGITLHIDADANGTEPVLNVNVALPDELTITTGDIYVAKSGTVDAATAAAQYVDATKAKILDNVTVVLGGATMNIQLGNAPQGSFITLGGTVTGGVTLSNFSILAPTLTTTQWTALNLPASLTQSATDRGIHMSSISVKSKDSADLSLTGTKINIANQGLVVSGTSNIDVRIKDLKLGSKAGTAALGDIALLDLKVPTLVVRGH